MKFRPILLSLLATGLVWAGEAPATLRLTHEQALRLGITNLLQSRIARELRNEIRQAPEAARGSFDWLLAASAADGRLETGDYNPRASGLDNLFLTNSNVTLDARSASLGVSKLDAYGGTVNLSLNTGYNAYGVQLTSQTLPVGPMGSVGYNTLNPYTGSLNLSYTQPLLRGFGRAATEAKLRAAIDQARGADESFRARLVQLLTLVDNLYWDQVFASQNLENKKVALKLAQTHLDEDQEQVKAGMLASIELPQVEAAVAEREKQLYAAEAGLANAQQALMENLFPDPDRPDALDLVDAPGPGPLPVPLSEAKASALSHRPELAQAHYSLAISRTLEKAADNAVLPQLDTQVAVLRDTTAHGDVNGVLTDLNQGHYPGYYVGLSFSYPIGNRTRKAQLSQARAATRSSEFLVKDTRTAVNLDVELAYTDLITARKQVEALDKALSFRLLSLEAEMSKLENGMSTSFYVLQRQDELDQARTADLEARIASEKARTSLARAMGTLVETVE
jgi:outer membrane protein TolC